MAFQSIRKSLSESVESSSRNIACHFFWLSTSLNLSTTAKAVNSIFFRFASTSVKKIAKLKIIPVFLENVYRFLKFPQCQTVSQSQNSCSNATQFAKQPSVSYRTDHQPRCTVFLVCGQREKLSGRCLGLSFPQTIATFKLIWRDRQNFASLLTACLTNE